MTRDFDDWYNEKVEQESYREFFNLKTKDDWDKWVRDKIIRRIEKLEEGENLTQKTENFLGQRISKLADIIEHRLKELEKWKKWEVTTHITGQRIVNETTDNRIKALEEWKDSKSGMNFYDSMFSALQKQIKELLEWKQVTESLDYGKFLAWQHTALVGGWKAVDKSAWEQIRKFLDDIFKSVPMSPGRIEYTKKLVEKQDK